MRFALNSVTSSLIVGAFPLLVTPVAVAAEFGKISVTDPDQPTSVFLHAGDRVVFTAPDGSAQSAVTVSWPGNTFYGAGVLIQAGNAGDGMTRGVVVTEGGMATLVDSNIATNDTYIGYGLLAHGAGSVLSLNGGAVNTTGRQSDAVTAAAGASIRVAGAQIETSGAEARGVVANDTDTSIDLRDSTVFTTGNSSDGVAAYNGSKLTLSNTDIRTSGAFAFGLDIGASTVTAEQLTISSAQASAIRLIGGTLFLDGGALTAYYDTVLLAPGGLASSASAVIRNATLSSQTGYGINLNAQGSSATLVNASISTAGNGGSGIWLPSADTTLSMQNSAISTQGDMALGIDNRGGVAIVDGGNIITRGKSSFGLYASHEDGAQARITASGLSVATFGDGAIGALARRDGATITLDGANLTTLGRSAYGLYVTGGGATLSASNTQVATSGADAAGAVVSNGALLSLDGSRIVTAGTGAAGVWSFSTQATGQAVVPITGSHIETQDAPALLATGGSHTFSLTGSSVIARRAGQEQGGLLLQSGALEGADLIASTQVTLRSSSSDLIGDIDVGSGNFMGSLAAGSVLTGAINANGGSVTGFAVDSSSVWNVRGNSTLGTLDNTGVVAFVAPGSDSGFKTLRVNDYHGGGTLVVNTYLGGDASATDRLVIDGGTTTATTAMRIMNAGGAGGQTVDGIRVVQAINGGTTAADAFRLDPGSSGYRASSATLAISGYDYSLVRKGTGSTPEDWYLTSVYSPPTSPSTPSDPSLPTVGPDTDKPGVRQVSPESGAYLGNRWSATSMFTHTRHDRDDLRRTLGEDGEPLRVWARTLGYHGSGMHMAQGNVDIDTDRYVLQMGADILRQSIGDRGTLYAGLMAGYGTARSTSTSSLVNQQSGATVRANARGQVQGYATGGYLTYYADEVTGLGSYADTWVQYGRFRNQLSSELGSTRYGSGVFSVSAEYGYALKPFGPGGPAADWVFEPHIQLVYANYDANHAQLQNLSMGAEGAHSWQSRLGARFYLADGLIHSSHTLRPFVEMNWLHQSTAPSVRMGAVSMSAAGMRDALEMKGGVSGYFNRQWEASVLLVGTTGSGDQRSYGGQVSVAYHW